MNKLSLHISKMNNLKNKIFSVAKGIRYKDHNTLQNSSVKVLTINEIKDFIYFFEKVSFDSAHFEIINISKDRIKVLLITSIIQRDHYNDDCNSFLKKEVVRLKNIFK